MNDIQMLLDEREISRGLGRFARVLDEKRWNDLSTVFASDLTFNYGADSEEAGIEALEHQMRKYLDVCGPTQHLLGSIMIEVDGNTALSHAYVQARHQRRDDPAGVIFDSTGEYHDRWERRPEGWRIVRRDAIWLLHSGDPAILATQVTGLG